MKYRRGEAGAQGQNCISSLTKIRNGVGTVLSLVPRRASQGQWTGRSLVPHSRLTGTIGVPGTYVPQSLNFEKSPIPSVLACQAESFIRIGMITYFIPYLNSTHCFLASHPPTPSDFHAILIYLLIYLLLVRSLQYTTPAPDSQTISMPLAHGEHGEEYK